MPKFTVCVWQTNKGWLWDDAEDHRGYDRISPMGPFTSRSLAMADANTACGVTEAINGYPDHYPSAESE